MNESWHRGKGVEHAEIGTSRAEREVIYRARRVLSRFNEPLVSRTPDAEWGREVKATTISLTRSANSCRIAPSTATVATPALPGSRRGRDHVSGTGSESHSAFAGWTFTSTAQGPDR